MTLSVSVDEVIEESDNPLLGCDKSWDRIRLDEIADIINGDSFNSEYFVETGGVPILRIRDIGKQSTEKNYDGEYDEKYRVYPGDLIVGMDGDFVCDLWDGPQALLNQRVCKITPNEELYKKKFLYYVLQPYLDAIHARTSSTTVKHLSSKDVKDIPLPFPPLEEQENIISKIEALFTQLEAGVEELHEARERLEKYEESLEEIALEGELTKNWRSNAGPFDEPQKRVEKLEEERYNAWEHYEREKKKKRGENVETDRWKQKYDSPLELTVDDLPELPESWTWVTLDTVTAYDVDYRGKTPPYSESGIPVISSGNVQEDEIVIDDPKYVSEETYSEWLTRGVPEPGDLLITTEAPPGDTAIFPDDQRYLPTRRIITFKTVGVDNRFVQLCFNYSVVERYIRDNSRGTTVDRILKDTLFETPIPLPPLSEQQEIVNRMRHQDTVIENALNAINENMDRAQMMKKSVLSKAVNGELVDSNATTSSEQDVVQNTKPETTQITLNDVQ